MLKNRIAQFYIKGNSKASYFTERLKSRSKLDKRKNRYTSDSKNSNKNKQNNFKTIESYSVKKEKKINLPNHKTPIKNTLNDILKDKMSYIPDIERKKSESDFISLINALVNSQQKRHNTCNNIFMKSKKDIPFKPKGYDYFEYIHQHPTLISEDDDNLYSKIVNDLKKYPESDNYRYYNRAQPITLNRLIKHKNMLNDSSSKENNKKIELKPIIAQSHKFFHKLNFSNDNNKKNLNLDSKNDSNLIATNDFKLSHDYKENINKFQYFKNIYEKTNDSIISKEFVGFLEILDICEHCHQGDKITIKTFETLSFNLDGAINTIKNNCISINQCFKYYYGIKKENIKCNKCNLIKYKKCDLLFMPRTLIITLNYGNKTKTKFIYEEYLNLTHFVTYNKESPYYYELVGIIVNLQNNQNGNHFISYCKNSNNCFWYKYDNDIVVRSSIIDVTSHDQPFVLFYSYITA